MKLDSAVINIVVYIGNNWSEKRIEVSSYTDVNIESVINEMVETMQNHINANS